MNQIFRNSLLFASVALIPTATQADDAKILYKDLVQPILTAKCVQCHGAEKQKGKLRLDSLEEVMKGSDGENVIPGKVEDSLLTFRITLPKDDDEAMPPEDEAPLSEAELAVLKFWVQSGAKGDAKIGDLKPAGADAEAIKVVLANPPKAPADLAAADPPKEIDPAKLKLAEETIGRVEKDGASLMAIAQDTPDLRFSALNVAKEYGDKNLELLKPVADQVKWMDLARTQVTDAGLAHLAGMKSLSRLHLENTKITDAGLEHLKGLSSLEYLNLYGTEVTDAGIQKLAGLKNLKKLFVWQTKVTNAGADKLAAAIAGIDINTGWKEPAKPVVVAANTTKPPEGASPTAPAKPAPAKPTPTPEKKPEPAKPTPAPPKPVAEKKPEPAKPTATPPKKPEPAKPAPAPASPVAIADLGSAINKALSDAKAASEQAKATASAAKTASDNSAKVSGEAQKIAAAAKGAADSANAASTEAKTVAAAAQKTASEAQQAATEAKQAAAAAQKAAAEATKVATETRALLMELQKAAAAIVGAAEKK